jgi:dTDP-4-dehydrorhamnose reductase
MNMVNGVKQEGIKPGDIIWVVGSQGYMGTGVVKRLQAAGYRVVGTDSELSVREYDRLEAFAEEIQPRAIVNCAGIRRDATGLSNRIKAYETNALGARNLALAASTVGALMVQVSSDDVYATVQAEPVNEFDNPHPNTPYGKSKRAGEMMVRDTTPDHLIVRSSWVYRTTGGRLQAALQAAMAGEKYEARLDQFAAPTSMSTYVKVLVEAMERGARGTLHITTKGRVSRYEFASRALEFAGYDPNNILVPVVDPATAEDIVLESLLLEMVGIDMPTWEEDLKNYLAESGLLKV